MASQRPTATASRGVTRGDVVAAVGVLRSPLSKRWTLKTVADDVHPSRSILYVSTSEAAYHPTSTRNHPTLRPETAKPSGERGVSRYDTYVEVAGIEPASFSTSPGLLRAQLAVLFSAPAITQARRRQAQPLFVVPPSPAAGSGGKSF